MNITNVSETSARPLDLLGCDGNWALYPVQVTFEDGSTQFGAMQGDLHTWDHSTFEPDEAGEGDDVSEYADEPDEPSDGFRDDVEADADVLRMAGYGTDEDYGHYSDDGNDYF